MSRYYELNTISEARFKNVCHMCYVDPLFQIIEGLEQQKQIQPEKHPSISCYNEIGFTLNISDDFLRSARWFTVEE